ncbi:hypothetical protein J3R30DRAFT_3343196 [Lentinula aciculospora]|uniref:Uncharacterized protein n=1 Tax=Lentinula aciculospora TaxID=153920 RepID=A0A9W8ZZJ6_9AGAR|nr:hypothetical protein J3R30DRAFT_3343196 [Lentinula aciculospora]
MLRTLSRTSSKPKKISPPVSLFVVASDDKIDRKRNSPCIPLELIELVLSLLPWGVCTRSTLSLALTSGFARASRTFRRIVFRNFFKTVWLQDSCWHRTLQILSLSQARTRDSEGFDLIRTLKTRPTYIIKDCKELKRLRGLRVLCINFDKEGLQTQHPICQRLFPHLVSSKLSSLTLDMIPRIDRTLLSFVSETFPCLKTLLLSVVERLTVDRDCDCWCCFEDVLECCVHSPVPDVYGDVNLLAESYGAALQPLTRLVRLQLGIFLSNEQIIYEHITHPDGDDNCFATSPSDCTKCDMFRNEVHAREELASEIVFQRLPNLRQIKWSTFFNRPNSKTVSGGPSQRRRISFQSGWTTFEARGGNLVRL